MNERLAKQISDVLKKVCPAFEDRGSQSAGWHGCFCKAQPSPSSPCVCVWHLTSVCPAGKWPQLDFVDTIHGREKERAKAMLVQVQAAMENS